jgi:hypothetical protein
MNVPTTAIAALIRRVALTSVSAVALTGLSASAAFAGQSQEIATEGGSVVFRDRGETIRALDERRDGYGVGAYLEWYDKEDGEYHRDHAIDATSGKGPARRSFAIREGTIVGLMMCYTRNGHAVPGMCSEKQQAVA